MRYGRVEVPALVGAVGSVMRVRSADWALGHGAELFWAMPLLAHHLFRRRERFDVGRSRKDPFGILQKRYRILGHIDAVVIEAPQKRRDRHVEHRKVVAKHVLVLEEDRRELGEAVANLRSGPFELLVGRLDA